MKYPYIGECVNGTVLFSSKGIGAAIEKGRRAWASTEKLKFLDGWDEFDFTNITHEYLSNTWGVVESKEHAEFIIELAELHGLGFYDDESRMFFTFNEDLRLFFYDADEYINKNRCKQITIPLPPKAELPEAGHNLVFAAPECKEWPRVNDEVIYNGELCRVLLPADKSGHIVVDKNGDYCNPHIDDLQKPKAPEETLRDDVSELICKSNEQWLNSKGERQITVHDFVANHLLTKYNITPKEV